MPESNANSAGQRPPVGGFFADFTRFLPTVVLAVATALGTSWCNMQRFQTDTERRIDVLEKKAEANAAGITALSNMSQQNAIRMAEIGVIQNNIAEQLKELKLHQAGK